ncbi:MAG TPA: ABC transporter transmembrane domain-containing protein [Vicinamibacterales bacterium]|nr:ABC transporter transmembrane domain-containing protein [Vicinamibacterales bacterium]
MNALFRLHEYVRPYRGRLVWAAVAMIVYGAASAGVVLQVRPILDEELFRRSQLADAATRSFSQLAAAILGLYFAKGLAAYLSSYLMTDVGQRVVRDLRNVLFRHILGQSAAFFTAQTSGRLMSRIVNDVSQLQRAVSETLGDLARESIALLGFAGVMVYYHARLALFCFTVAPLIVYPLFWFGQRVRRSARRSQEALEHITHVSAEAFTGHRIVKAFGAEEREAAQFGRASGSFYRTAMKVNSVLAMLPPMMEFIGGLAFVLALWYGSQEIQASRLTPGQFVGFMTALFMMYAPARKLSRVNADLQQARAAAERIFEMLDTHTEVHERPDARPLPPFREAIEFADVRFSYGGTQSRTLEQLNLTVGAGQTVAIVGRSGAGKTTLVNLIPRFYDVTGGRILIDGVDIRDVTLASLRSQIGMVTQEAVLFDDTVAANIAYGRPAASAAEVEAAARAAHAHDFIVRLDNGYQAVIGERGQRLSGGQRQRLAIARAILRNSPILILDEATSALDTESEMLVQDALATLMLNRTSFVIAHRLSTVRRADVILVLDRGRIVERGTHDELLARGGAYAKLYELQLQEDPAERGAEREARAESQEA